jgi:uncharacterized membrane protein
VAARELLAGAARAWVVAAWSGPLVELSQSLLWGAAGEVAAAPLVDDSLFVCLALAVVAAAAMLNGAAPMAVAKSFGDGFWSLITFTTKRLNRSNHAFMFAPIWLLATCLAIRDLGLIARRHRQGVFGDQQ